MLWMDEILKVYGFFLSSEVYRWTTRGQHSKIKISEKSVWVTDCFLQEVFIKHPLWPQKNFKPGDGVRTACWGNLEDDTQRKKHTYHRIKFSYSKVKTKIKYKE